jgi:hypothetical protein
MMRAACSGARHEKPLNLWFVRARFCAVSSAFGSLTNEFISFSNRGIGRCIKAQRLNADGSPAAPYLPQEGCGMAPFERSIGLLGPELALAFDADDAAVSCGGMFFPMQASLPALLCVVLQPPCNAVLCYNPPAMLCCATTPLQCCAVLQPPCNAACSPAATYCYLLRLAHNYLKKQCEAAAWECTYMSDCFSDCDLMQGAQWQVATSGASACLILN